MYSDSTPVLCSSCFYSDKFDPYKYGKEYDFSKNFFDQLRELFLLVPRLHTFRVGNLINSDYASWIRNSKNVYLSCSVSSSEDSMYLENSDFIKNSFDIFASKKLDNCYYNIGSDGNYNTHFAVQSINCLDSLFIYDCINCTSCFLCYSLRNKKYCYKNEQLTKEGYNSKIESIGIDKFSNLKKTREEFGNLIKNKAIHKFAWNYHSDNVSGDYISNSKNIKRCFNCYDSENVSFSSRILGPVKDTYDCYGTGFGSELIYESVASSVGAFKDYFSYLCIDNSRECEYCLILKNCHNCFGCVSLQNASFRILNKQYSEEEYFETVEKIKKQMNDVPYIDSKNRTYKYGEFFPPDMSPFGYNETVALDFFPIDEVEAESMGYNWKIKDKKDYQPSFESENLPDSIKDVSDDIIKETIECPNQGEQKYQCSSAFKIMPEELKFYRTKNLPLPRFCPNCRHYDAFKYYNPMKLWHRKCMKPGCTKEFETPYAPDRPEIVYCEQCYNAEVA